MTWTQTSGVLTHSGTDRTCWRCNVAQPSSNVIRLQLASRAHKVALCLFSHRDMRTCFEVCIDGANIRYRKVTLGVPVADTVVAHGIAAGEPFNFEANVQDGRVYVVISASGFTTTQNNQPIPTELLGFTAWGVSSTVNGATVQSLGIYERRPIIQEANEVCVPICAGDVWQSTGDTAFQRIGAGSFANDVFPRIAEFNGELFALDGTKVKRINVIDRAVYDYGPGSPPVDWTDATTGFPPGSVDLGGGVHQKGTTKATAIAVYNRRLVFAYNRSLYFTAIGDPYDHLLSADPNGGGAYVYGPFRDPILSLTVTQDNVLVIGGTRSFVAYFGDPIDSNVEVRYISESIGVSGGGAVSYGVGAPMVAHTPEGLMIVPVTGTPTPLSSPVLTQGITFDYRERDTLAVSVVRAPASNGLHTFITPRNGTVGNHFWYDERIGAYQPGAGGFIPDTFPVGQQPTCAAVWRGRPVFGCADGFLRELNPAAKTDGGAPIAAFVFSEELDLGGIDSDSIISDLAIEMDKDGDVGLVQVLGGYTAKALYDPATRVLLWQNYAPPGDYMVDARMPVLAVAISSGPTNNRWIMEGIDADVDAAHRFTREAPITIPLPQLACGVAAASPTADVPPPFLPPPPPGGGEVDDDADECGPSCSHAEGGVDWMAILAAKISVAVPSLSCCCSPGSTINVSMSRLVQWTDSGGAPHGFRESASGSGPIGTRIECTATADLFDTGASISGYTIPVRVDCGQQMTWYDPLDKQGFVDAAIGAGAPGGGTGTIVITAIEGALNANCDNAGLAWKVDMTVDGQPGIAFGTVTISVIDRTVGCAT